MRRKERKNLFKVKQIKTCIGVGFQLIRKNTFKRFNPCFIVFCNTFFFRSKNILQWFAKYLYTFRNTIVT